MYFAWKGNKICQPEEFRSSSGDETQIQHFAAELLLEVFRVGSTPSSEAD